MRKSKSVLRFERPKSVGIDKDENKVDNLLKEKKLKLSSILKSDFERYKIKRLENQNQESNVENKFKRDKSAVTQRMNRLKENICKLILINFNFFNFYLIKKIYK